MKVAPEIEAAAAYLLAEAVAMKSGAGLPVPAGEAEFAGQRLRACAAGLLAGLHLEEPFPVGGVGAIAAERARQIGVEGWTVDHDDEHAATELAGAAACYVLASIDHWNALRAAEQFWPWSADWWKPRDRRSNLVRAGALIAAEIDRMDREAEAQRIADAAEQLEAEAGGDE